MRYQNKQSFSSNPVPRRNNTVLVNVCNVPFLCSYVFVTTTTTHSHSGSHIIFIVLCTLLCCRRPSGDTEIRRTIKLRWISATKLLRVDTNPGKNKREKVRKTTRKNRLKVLYGIKCDMNWNRQSQNWENCMIRLNQKKSCFVEYEYW